MMKPDLEFDGPRLIRPDELRASQRLSQVCFEDIVDTGDEGADLPLQFHNGETYLIACQGKPVSQISIFHTPLKMQDGVVHVGSIGGVCTHPDFRGYGLATRLMDHCTRQLVQDGAGLMLISGGRGLYTRLGNVPFGKYAGFTLRPGMLRPPAANIRLRPVTPADAGICGRIYQAEPVHFVRKYATFEKYFQPHEVSYHAEEWVVEMDGQPAAYLLLNIPWNFFSKPEAGVRSTFEYAGSPLALAGGLAAALTMPGIREIQATIAWQDLDLIHLLTEGGASPQWTALEDHTVRIINFPALMAGLRPYLQARLGPALQRGLRFEQCGPLLAGGAGSGASSGTDSSGEGEGRCAIIRGRDRLELDTAAMTRLVIGNPHGKLGPEFKASGALAEILPALFPLLSFLPGLDYH